MKIYNTMNVLINCHQPGICSPHKVSSMHSVSCPFLCSQTICLVEEYKHAQYKKWKHCRMEHTTYRHNFSETTGLGVSSPNNGFQAHVFFFPPLFCSSFNMQVAYHSRQTAGRAHSSHVDEAGIYPVWLHEGPQHCYSPFQQRAILLSDSSRARRSEHRRK